MQITRESVNPGIIPKDLRERLRGAGQKRKIAAWFSGLLRRVAGWLFSITDTSKTRQNPAPPAVSQSAPERKKPPAPEREQTAEPPPLPQSIPE